MTVPILLCRVTLDRRADSPPDTQGGSMANTLGHLQGEHAVGYHLSDEAAEELHEKSHALVTWSHSHPAAGITVEQTKTDAEHFVWRYYFNSQHSIAKSLEFSMFHADESVELFRALPEDQQVSVLSQLGFYTIGG